MGARLKLNYAYVSGSFLLAACIGLLSGSWLAFVIALVLLLALNLSTSEIRLSKRGHR